MSQAGRYIQGSGAAPVETLTGNTGGPVPPTGGNINVIGAAPISVTGNPGTSTLTIDSDGTLAITYTEDSGTATPAADNLNIFGSHGINTSGSGDTVTVAINNAITLGDLANITGSNALTVTTGNVSLSAGNIVLPTTTATPTGAVFVGVNRFMHSYGVDNTFVGITSGNFTATGTNNDGFGKSTLAVVSSGSLNTALGANSLNVLTTGSRNTAVGQAYQSLVSGNDNIGIGYGAGVFLTTGSWNIILGNYNTNGGQNYTLADSSNICIGNAGSTGESNAIRIGINGSSTAQQNKCFIAGITGITPAGVSSPVIIDTNGQLGSTSLTNGQLLIGSTGASPVAATLTAGTNISISNGAGSITINATPDLDFTYTAVNSTPYVVLDTDQFLGVDCSGAPITVQLPNAPSTGRVVYIKDSTGSANTNNITVTTVGGAVNIDGATSYTMNTQYSSIAVIFNGTSYEIF